MNKRLTKRVNDVVVYIGEEARYKNTGDTAGEISFNGIKDIMNQLCDYEDANEQVEQDEKKTGYERVRQGEVYFYQDSDGPVNDCTEEGIISYDDYEVANYYSDITVAENNARADKLMRQLRRFAIEHRFEDIRWHDDLQWKHYIVWDCGVDLSIYHCTRTREPGVVYFDSVESAADAIDIFRDELIWYFTEYKDSL